MEEQSENNRAEVSETAELVPVKLTKKALNDFIGWTTSRYNDYLGHGTKKENVDRVFRALTVGNDNGKAVFEIQCASPVGENGRFYKGEYRGWKTKQCGDDYTIDCIEKTVTAKHSKRVIKFFSPPPSDLEKAVELLRRCRGYIEDNYDEDNDACVDLLPDLNNFLIERPSNIEKTVMPYSEQEMIDCFTAGVNFARDMMNNPSNSEYIGLIKTAKNNKDNG